MSSRHYIPHCFSAHQMSLSQNAHLLTEFHCPVSPLKNGQLFEQNGVDKIVYKEFSRYVIL